MKNKEKEILKSEDLFHARFWTKTGESFFKWWETTTILQKVFCERKNVKTWVFKAKHKNDWSHKLVTLYKDNLDPALKENYEKTANLWRQPFNVNLTFEIYKYFHNLD